MLSRDNSPRVDLQTLPYSYFTLTLVMRFLLFLGLLLLFIVIVSYQVARYMPKVNSK